MKKVLVCALAALFLMATCLTAFAEPTHNTTTSYVNDELVVTTTVTAADNGEMITYLAYKGEAADTPADDDILYIDQQTWEGTNLTFTYTTAKENLSGVTVKSGTSDADVAAAEVIELGARTITVKAEGQTDDTIVLPSTTVASAIATDIAVTEGYSVESVTLADGTAVTYTADNGKISITDSAALTDGSVVTVVLKKDYTAPAPTVATEEDGVYGNSFTLYDEDNNPTEEKLAVLGKVTTDATASDSTNVCGIILSTDYNAISAATPAVDGETVVEYRAFAKNNAGFFAIQLVNQNMDKRGLATTDYYARIYAVNSENVRVYGDVITIAGDK